MSITTINREQLRNDAKALAGSRTAQELRDRAVDRPDDAATLTALATGLEALGYLSVTDLADHEIDEVLAGI